MLMFIEPGSVPEGFIFMRIGFARDGEWYMADSRMPTFWAHARNREAPAIIVKPEKWRANPSENYFFISDTGEVLRDSDVWGILENMRYDIGNYYRTEETAKRARDRVLLVYKEEE